MGEARIWTDGRFTAASVFAWHPSCSPHALMPKFSKTGIFLCFLAAFSTAAAEPWPLGQTVPDRDVLKSDNEPAARLSAVAVPQRTAVSQSLTILPGLDCILQQAGQTEAVNMSFGAYGKSQLYFPTPSKRSATVMAFGSSAPRPPRVASGITSINFTVTR